MRVSTRAPQALSAASAARTVIASPFPRCCSAMSRSRSGRGWCASPTSAPVAAGFWRLALALPFLCAARPRCRAAGRTGRGAALVIAIAVAALLLRRRSRRLARRHPHDQARQCDPVRQFRRASSSPPGACGWRGAGRRRCRRLALLPGRGRRGAADGRQLRTVGRATSPATCSRSSPACSTPAI